MSRARRFLPLIAACPVLLLLAGSASAHYYFLHFAGTSAPFVPVPEKFDVGTLVRKTVYFYVSDQGPTQLADGDSFTAVLSQLQLAGQAWNDVATSDLRVRYGGLFTPGTPSATPHIEVTFDDLPPGLLAMGGPTSRGTQVPGPNGDFMPITAAVVVFNNKEMPTSTYPSYGSWFFLTAVHEMGHALGLQHTFTSSVMSTGVTRASTRAKPLGLDDIAGISALYPTRQNAAKLGSISGQVTVSGAGVHLASVIAMPAVGEAVSTFTNPDGTYKIDGVPPGQYYVYVHALPPSEQSDLGPSEVVLPLDADGNPIAASAPFRAQFYPGTQDPQKATTVGVTAGQDSGGIDFSVEPQAAPQLYGVQTYSYPGDVAVKPAYVNTANPSRAFLIAAGTGLIVDQTPAAGLKVSVLGDSLMVSGAHSYYDPNFLEVDFVFSPFTALGPRQLVFSAGNELYVLPAGLILVNRQPPAIGAVNEAVDGDGNRVINIDGTNLYSNSRVLFDGVPAAVAGVDESNGRIVVRPPQGASGYTARLVALNSDGQTSLMLQTPPAFTYEESPAPSVALATTALPAGVEAMVEIQGANTHFAEGQTRVGFGSADVVVKRLWVVSPTLVRADVLLAPAAAAASTELSVATGFEAMAQASAFEIKPPDVNAVSVSSDLVNPATGQLSVYPGGTAVLTVSNLSSTDTPIVKLNDTAVKVTSSSTTQVSFEVPVDFQPGLTVLTFEAGGSKANPVIVRIDPAPPVILSVSIAMRPVDAEHPAQPGDTLTITVSQVGMTDPVLSADRLNVNVGGIDHMPVGPGTAVHDQKFRYTLDIILSPDVAGPQANLTVSIDGRRSAVYGLAVKTT